MKVRTIKVDMLARVEGEGGLLIKMKGDEVQDVEFRIFEPPRFFEAFLRGRSYSEAPDITARICGICPIAYQMSAVHAIEDALEVKVEGPLRALRRLLYCGEWIESHVLHIYMLHAPDFLGKDDVIQMAKEHPKEVEQALRLKKTGNEIVRVGGFYKVPSKKDLVPLAEKLKWARDAARATVRWTAKLPFPEFEQDYEFVALRHPGEYPMNEGRLLSSKGLDIAVKDYESYFFEEHVQRSNALHSVLRNRGAYFVGPLARFNLNHDKLSQVAQEAAREVKFKPGCRNPFKSIIARAVETLYACDEALQIIEAYEPPEKPAVDIAVKAGTGTATTEAPRGILYHRYRLDDSGTIQEAKIVPPTSQNQKTIESDLREFVAKNIRLPQTELAWQCEQAIRNYDPCISCATHFLKLSIERV
jgi:coenzyme F420-reducing hydrogenase alpha subunit